MINNLPNTDDLETFDLGQVILLKDDERHLTKVLLRKINKNTELSL